MSFTDDQIDHYKAKGYVAGPRVLSDAQIEKLKDRIEDILHGRVPFPKHLMGETVEQSRAKGQLPSVKVVNIFRRDPLFAALIGNPAISALAHQLMPGPVRMWEDQMIYKPPHDEETALAWHQDYTFWDHVGPADLGTCWIALDDATVDNGCMHVIPGSHLWPMRYAREDAAVDDPHWLLRQEGIPAGADLTPVPCEVPAGHCHFHHCKTFHGSYGNSTGNPRRSYIMHLMPGHTRRLGDNWNERMGNVETVGVGEVLRGEEYPELVASPSQTAVAPPRMTTAGTSLAERHPMNYWMTTHWPPRVDQGESGSTTGVWIREGRQQAAHDLEPGDYVAVYETKTGPIEIDTQADGKISEIHRKLGRQGMICYGTVDSRLSASPDEPVRYKDGTEVFWRWHAPVSIASRTGFVALRDVLPILGYKSGYNLHGFGDYRSGLKKITKEQFDALVRGFHAARPIELPTNTGVYAHRPGGGEEGLIHRNLKRYVMADPGRALQTSGLRFLRVEYELPTSDRVDIVLADSYDRIIGVEIEPSVSVTHLAGPLQAIKYRYMLECLTHREPGDSRGMLIAHEIDGRVKAVCRRYGIECYEIPQAVVDSWAQSNPSDLA